MDKKTLCEKYLKSTIEYLHAFDILSRGLVACDNDSLTVKSPFLLTGINPSFPASAAKHPGQVDLFVFAKALESDRSIGHWGKKKKQFGDIYKEMAYLDLFPIRETDQVLFEKTFQNMISLRRDLLEITQEAIEEMSPRLIVHANRGSMYYWGVDEHNPWKGYKLTPVGINTYPDLPLCMKSFDRMKRFPLYRIDGFVDSPKRINQERFSKTALEGCFLMEYVMEYRKKEEQETLYTPKEWEEIWAWVKHLNH